MVDETTTEMLAEIDRDLVEIEKAVSGLQQQAAQANYPQPVETTTDRLAEIGGQSADYTPPEGWRVLAVGEKLQAGDMTVRSDGYCYSTERVGYYVGLNQRYIRRIEPEPEPQPVQVREGRWRTRGGDIRHVTPTPDGDSRAITYPWHDARCDQTWLSSGRYHTGHTESPLDLFDYLGPIEPEPEQIITPDDVAAEALAGVNEWPSMQTLQRKLETAELALLEQQQRNEQLVTQGSQHRMQIAELRSEVSHVQRLLGESKRRVAELETLVADLRAVNTATEPQPEASPVLQQVMIEAQAETIARLNSEIHGLNIEIVSLETQLETVKAEVVQERLERNRWHNQVLRVTAELEDKTSECRNLQIELDALQQAPQAETVAAVPTSASDRFEEGWDAGTARAVETIAEWTEPFRTCGSQGLSYHVMQNLPHIMRTLTGLADED